jgi:hypothetical protein
LDPLVDFMTPVLQLQVTTDDRPNGSSGNLRSNNPHFLVHSPLSKPDTYNSTIALADVDYDKNSSMYQPAREAQATY